MLRNTDLVEEAADRLVVMFSLRVIGYEQGAAGIETDTNRMAIKGLGFPRLRKLSIAMEFKLQHSRRRVIISNYM